MANFNRVIIMGNLTRDPDYKEQPSGQALCRLSLASNRQFRNKQTGNLSQEVCYIDATVWGPQAENCRQYLHKGRPVLVEGRLRYDTWKDAEGQSRQRHTIVADNVIFLGGAQRPEQQAADESESGIPLEVRTTPATKVQDESTGEKATATADVLFKDEAPFTDDLPF